jgi:hypothetical protein
MVDDALETLSGKRTTRRPSFRKARTQLSTLNSDEYGLNSGHNPE